MIAVDTNILLYAHFRRFPEHAKARGWLRALAEGNAPWALPVFCVGEFLRVATHARAMDRPSSVETAWTAVDNLLGSPSVRVLLPGSRFLPVLSEVLREGDARGNLVFDAQIAALCIEHGATRLLTADRDFSRFRRIRIVGLSEPVDS